MPFGVSTSRLGPPCSHNNCRHRPHGMIFCRSTPPTHVKATSRPPPPAISVDTRPHSAQRVTPYEAFSTLHPVTVRPSSTSAAAPTGDDEDGAYAREAADAAAARRLSQST